MWEISTNDCLRGILYHPGCMYSIQCTQHILKTSFLNTIPSHLNIRKSLKGAGTENFGLIYLDNLGTIWDYLRTTWEKLEDYVGGTFFDLALRAILYKLVSNIQTLGSPSCRPRTIRQRHWHLSVGRTRQYGSKIQELLACSTKYNI